MKITMMLQIYKIFQQIAINGLGKVSQTTSYLKEKEIS